MRSAGRFAEASEAFRQAAIKLQRDGAPHDEAAALFAASGCEIRLFQYASALATLDRARVLAEPSHDSTLLGIIAGNVGVIYSQLGDFPAATIAAQRSVEYLKTSTRRDYFIMALGSLGGYEYGLNRTSEGQMALEQAIAIASAEGKHSLEATFCDNLGTWQLLNGHLTPAEQLLSRALRIRLEEKETGLIPVSYEHLAELEERKGPTFLPSALRHINLALAQRGALASDPHYYPVHVQGKIFRGLGRTEAALTSFRQAVNAADQWRQSALPGDATNIRNSVQLAEVYRDFVDLAAETSLKTSNASLKREAFEATVRNRQATLREQATNANRRKLLESPEYFSLLTRLQTAQASVTLGSNRDAGNSAKAEENRRTLDQLRTELNDLENRLGLGTDAEGLHANGRGSATVSGLQSRLTTREAILSFTLGQSRSYLWTVTKDRFELVEFAAEPLVLAKAARFRADVEQAASPSTRIENGVGLTRCIFASLPASVGTKSEWLVAADGGLLDRVPFSALPDPQENTKLLVETHSLRFLPAMFRSNQLRTKPPAPEFLGVGDPIYNRADSRWDRASESSTRPVHFGTIARLPGSRKELLSSASAAGLPRQTLLTGRDASGISIRKNLDDFSPEILHFAVHVLSPPSRPGEAALALSLNKDSVPEFLTAEAVATYHLPGSLVVLSGCTSQQGEVVPGAGLLGLGRSWLLAGASAVILSAWPTPDNSGEFFAIFYRYFSRASGSTPHRAAVALQQTQLETWRTGGFRAKPAFWAAYSIFAKE